LILDLLLFAVGLTALTLGADWLVTGAARVASQRGVSPLMVGLTIVAFGTSAPELVVSSAASLRGQSGLAIGNIMGSTVANVGLIVGLGALIRPISVHRRLIRREAPLLIGFLLIVMLLSFNGIVDRFDGFLLLSVFGFYIYYLFRWGHASGHSEDMISAEIEIARERGDPEGRRPWLNWARVTLGLLMLLLGADWLVSSAVEIARAFDVPEEVIGATLVAVGTSVPELASTIAAAARGLGDIAIGNVIGSNIFNLGLVLGTAAVVRPLEFSQLAVQTELLPAFLFCLALIPLAYTGARVSRAEGGFLLAGYALFIFMVI
jgi:cation:H+ antiporter